MTTGDAAYLPFREQFVSLAPDKYPPAWIDAQVWAGFWRCWGNDKAAVLAEIKIYPSGLREMHFLAVAGEVRQVLALKPAIEAWGRENGCKIAAAASREAWVKLMPDYEVEQIRIVKELV